MEAAGDIMSTLIAAQTEFVRRDAAAFADLGSHGDDVTIICASGGDEQG